MVPCKQLIALALVALFGTSYAARPISLDKEDAIQPMGTESADSVRQLLSEHMAYPSYPPPPPPLPPAVPTFNVSDENPIGSDSTTSQSVVIRSKITLPDSANKAEQAQNMISKLGNNGVIERTKSEVSTLNAVYDLALEMLNDALSGAPDSTAGRIQFTADENNDIAVELTLFYPDSTTQEEREQDAQGAATRINQRQQNGDYDSALQAAATEAGITGNLSVASFDVQESTEDGAFSLRGSLMGVCLAVGALLLLV